MTYSLDFRRKVLSVRKAEGLTIEEVAEHFEVGIASVTRWLKRVEPIRNRHKPATKIDMVALARDVEEYPDAYLYERAHRFGASVTGVFLALQRLGVSYKKNAGASSSRRRQAAYLPRTDSSTSAE